MRKRMTLLMSGLLGFCNGHYAPAKSASELVATSSPAFVDSGSTKVRVNPQWQKKFVEEMQKTAGVVEGWALFSGGGLTGYGNSGQIFVIKTQTAAKLYYVEKKSETFNVMKSLSTQAMQSFSSSVGTLSANLTDHWEVGFDMFETEFVHVVLEGHSLVVKQRVKWRFGRSSCEEHCRLATVFTDLVKSKS